MSKVTLIVNGVTYAGWVSASISRSIESIAGQFSLEISPFLGTDPQGGRVPNPGWSTFASQPPIQMEDECTVQLDDDIVLTGAVDIIRQKLSVNASSITIAGRDRAAVLADCTPQLKQLQFNGMGVLEFCQMIGDQFGITFYLQDGISDAAISTTPSAGAKKQPLARASGGGSTGKSTSATKVGNPKATLTIEPGETAFSLIDRACRMVGVLPISDGLGNVVLTRSSSDRCTTAIVEGQNLLDLDLSLDGTKRFGRYVVIGQNQPDTNGADDGADFDPTVFSFVSSTPDHGIDAGVVRSERVLLVTSDGAMTQAFANMRADWEATVRKARALSLDLAVQDWRQGDGTLWPLNAIVSVTSPSARIADDMLISTVAFSQSVEQGTRTILSVTAPDAFLPQPTTAGGKALASWWPAAGGQK